MNYIMLMRGPGCHKTFVSPWILLLPKTHNRRQATQHDCRSSWLGDGDIPSEKVYGDKKKIFCTGPTRAAKAEQKSLVPAPRAQRNNHESNPFIRYVLLESPFDSVSTLRRGHFSLVSLRSGETRKWDRGPVVWQRNGCNLEKMWEGKALPAWHEGLEEAVMRLLDHPVRVPAPEHN